jgi:hypothetical protein
MKINIDSEYKIDPKIAHLLLEPYLQDPLMSYTLKDFKRFLMEFSEDPIRKAIFALKRSKILEVEYQRGRPKGGKRVERYSISKELEAFKKLSKMYLELGIEGFLKSDYIYQQKNIFISSLKKEPYGSGSIADYIELDIQLKPLDSYPINYPPALLLRQPFDRIFSDVHIFNKDDVEKLIRRAYILYSNFSEIFSSAIKYTTNKKGNHDPMKYVESLVKQAIFYWNISSHNFDWVYTCLKDAYDSEGIGEYYVKFEEGTIFIYDVKKKFGKLPTYIAGDNLVNNYFLYEPDVQLASLRPCNVFLSRGLSDYSITGERIAKEVKDYFSKK